MRRRGFTLVEMVLGVAISMFVIMAATSLLVQSLSELGQTTMQTTLATENAQGLRFMSEKVRSAMSVTVGGSGTKLTYVLPKLSSTVDPTSGEREYVEPLVSDGVTRRFSIDPTAGTLTDTTTGKVLCRKIVMLDPDPASTQYNRSYFPFLLTSIGSSNAVQISLVTQDSMGPKSRYVRLKTVCTLRNTQ